MSTVPRLGAINKQGGSNAAPYLTNHREDNTMLLNDEKVAALKELGKLEEKLMFVGLMLAVERTDTAEKMLRDSLELIAELTYTLDDIFTRELRAEHSGTKLH